MRKLLILLLLAVASATALAQINEQENLRVGEVRVINALVGVGPVDVYINERLISTGLQPERATAFLPLSMGQYNVAVYLQGADPLSIPIADRLLDLAEGASKTIVVYQSRFATSDDSDTRSVLGALAQSGSMMILDDNRSPGELGKARLTAVHLAQGSPEKLSIAYPSRASLLHEMQFGIPYGDIDIDAGVYPLTVVDANSPQLQRLAFVGEQVFNANVHYTAIIVPDLPIIQANDGPALAPLVEGLRLFIVSAPIEPPEEGFQVRLIHAAADTTVVDVYIDSKLTAPRLRYAQFTEYIGLKSLSHLVELRERDAAPDSTPIATASIQITSENINQEHWTLMLLNGNDERVPALNLAQAQEAVDGNLEEIPAQIFNTPGGRMMMVLVPDNIAQTARNQARVRVLHAIDSALEISLWSEGEPRPLNGPTPTPATSNATPTPAPPVRLVNPVIYGAEANEEEVPAGLYPELNFIAGNATDLITLQDQWLLAGIVYTYVLIGQPDGEPPIQVLTLENYGRGIPQDRLYLGVVTSTVGVANVRRNPSNGALIVDQVESGTEVEVLGRNFDGEWIKIRFTPPGSTVPQDGWIFGTILRVTRLGDPINVLALPQVN